MAPVIYLSWPKSTYRSALGAEINDRENRDHYGFNKMKKRKQILQVTAEGDGKKGEAHSTDVMREEKMRHKVLAETVERRPAMHLAGEKTTSSLAVKAAAAFALFCTNCKYIRLNILKE